MPWRSRWHRPYNDALASAMRQAGFNGGVCDHLPRDDAEVHEKHGLLWYLDHAAGRGDLHLGEKWNEQAYRSSLYRPRCLLDPDVRDRLTGRVSRSVQDCLKYKTRAAYSLDDEISWSTYTNPCRWDNDPRTIQGFRAWLLAKYGSRGGILRQWGHDNERFLSRLATPDDFQHLYRRPVTQWNLSPWCDALTYMDSQLLNLVGELVMQANRIDPTTPCGIVGAQGPAPYGGYDYAKLMRKVQFLEVYNIGAAMEIARSFNDRTDMPLVASGTGDPTGADGMWWNWYGLAHGYRGTIVFADQWFGAETDMLRLGPEIRKLERASRGIVGAQWIHDGVAVYYSHPSIQVGWFLDCHVHGRTWIKRLSSVNNRLSSSHAAFWAWTRLLEDARIQYDFVSYADLIVKGLDPAEYKVLILPRVLALSDDEVEQIDKYVSAGGVVLADHMVGLFDHHGQGRRVPALDEMLEISKHPPVMAGNVFGGQFLSEFDAERYWSGTFPRAASEVWPRCLRARGIPIAERLLGPFIAARRGSGWLMLMNVSLAEYCQHRMQQSPQAAEFRGTVVELLSRAGVRPWLSLKIDSGEPPVTEATYWRKGGRRYVCIVKNPFRLGTLDGPEGGGGPGGPSGQAPVNQGTLELTVGFSGRQHAVKEEVTGKILGDGDVFKLPWKTDEAAIISTDDPDRGEEKSSAGPK
ncbi:MAG: beta-galactosidase trimerization domain-containing protein [Phycisphaerae bacterium]|nr:beta-galactosidase trimerization domain-containing protein [Phycisphaerae bacterium]